jgi:hypothetical protein
MIDASGVFSHSEGENPTNDIQRPELVGPSVASTTKKIPGSGAKPHKEFEPGRPPPFYWKKLVKGTR